VCVGFGWLVDPGNGRELGWVGLAVEAGGVGGVGGTEGRRPLGANLDRGAVVDRRGRVVADPGVAVLVVVVGEERLAERSGVVDGL
jgi:hypothetical protein